MPLLAESVIGFPLWLPAYQDAASCHADLPWLVEATDSGFRHCDRWPPSGAGGPVGALVWSLSHGGACRGAVLPRFAGRLKVVKVNVDRAPGISARLGVQGVPTLLLLRQGRVVARQVGALPESHLLSWVRGSLESVSA